MEHSITDDGDIRIVALVGEIDLQYSAAVRKLLLSAIPDARAIIVDLSGVKMIDSSGVAVLLEAFQAARTRGKDMALASAGDAVTRVLKLARLDTVFNLADDVRAAKRTLG